MRTSVLLVASALTVVVATSASADRLQPGGNTSGVISQIGAGVKEISLETQLVFRSDTTKGKEPAPDTTNSGLALIGGAIFKYFVIDNLAVGLHLGGFFRSNGVKSGDAEAKSSDVGFLGSVTAAYYISLGGGMFIAPIVGGGYFAGNRENKTTSTGAGARDLVLRYSLSGPVVRGGLGLVFYSSPRFNLFARPEAIVYLGSAKQKDEQLPAGQVLDPEARKFTTIDAGFTCGLSYVF